MRGSEQTVEGVDALPASGAATARAHDRLLLEWCALALGMPVNAGGAPATAEGLPDLLGQLWLHRLGELVWPEMERAGLAQAPDAARWIAHFRTIAGRMNGLNLVTMRRLLPRFEAAGLSVLAFKGPIVQQMAYGNLFMRPSSDLDLLVDPASFARGGAILREAGYELAAVCRSLWWRAGLGEQHYRVHEGAGATIDLHHRVQQPGCPLPRLPSAFVEEAGEVEVAGHAVRTFSHRHTMLLSAMSYVKALHHREPAARYAIDLAALGRGLNAADWTDVEVEARRQGLGNTLSLTQRGARLLLGEGAAPAGASPAVLAHTSDETLFQMTLRPADPLIDWPRRRTLLYALFDQKRDFPLGFALMVGSDLLRQAARQ